MEKGNKKLIEKLLNSIKLTLNVIKPSKII